MSEWKCTNEYADVYNQVSAQVKTITELRARIAGLERTIIEADACYNADCRPTTIEAAELALVLMCGYGREALDEHEAALQARDGTCAWSEDADGDWHTSCGELYAFTDGGPEDNHAVFCHACGKRIEVVKYQESEP